MQPRTRIGYLPFYVDYYEGICPTFGAEKKTIADRCAAMLSAHGELLWDGQLLRDVEGARAAGQVLAAQRPDCVVVAPTIAVFGGIAWAALRDLDVPIIVWNAQLIETVGAGYTMTEIVRNTGQIGVQALANTLLREGRAFRVVTGHLNSERTASELSRLLRIAGAVTAMRRARLLQAGSTFPLMTDIELDEAYLRHHLGATITKVSEAELTSTYQAIDDTAVAEHTVRLHNDNTIEGIADDELARSVRLSEALNCLVARHEADAGTLNCHGPNCLRNPEIGVTACYALGAQNAEGRPFTCTGDLPTALAMLLLKKLTDISMYTEVQVMDETREAIVIANSGEGEAGIRRAEASSLVRGNSNFTGLHGRGASFAYPLQPGPATLLSLTPSPHGALPFRLIAAEGEILGDPLPDAGALAGFFRFSHTGLHDGYTRWLEAGAVHHAGTTTGHCSADLRDAAEWLGWEFVRI